jgi:glycerol-3-phosphate dehydrogenase
LERKPIEALLYDGGLNCHLPLPVGQRSEYCGTMPDFDLAIIGGGINGAGIARDAAGRGLKVVLLEQGDLAAGTSSASSKLIHGGLRYLEHGALRLVRAALSEREVLLRMAPHLIRPLRFVLPLDSRYRSPALLRLGLFIYDAIGRREILPPTRNVDLAVDATGVPLRRHFSSRLRIFRLLCRRFAPCRAQRARCGRARRPDSHPHTLRAC